MHGKKFADTAALRVTGRVGIIYTKKNGAWGRITTFSRERERREARDSTLTRVNVFQLDSTLEVSNIGTTRL